jgi:hypothetical protein
VAHAAFRYLKNSGAESLEILNQVLTVTKDEGKRGKIMTVIKAIEAGDQCIAKCGRG